MAEWRPWIDTFLNESLRLHGRGFDYGAWNCDTCGIPWEEPSVEQCRPGEPPKDSRVDTTEVAGPPSSVQELFRCRTCGSFHECQACCLRRHQRTPLHKVEVCFSCSVGLEAELIMILGLALGLLDANTSAQCGSCLSTKSWRRSLHFSGPDAPPVDGHGRHWSSCRRLSPLRLRSFARYPYLAAVVPRWLVPSDNSNSSVSGDNGAPRPLSTVEGGGDSECERFREVSRGHDGPLGDGRATRSLQGFRTGGSPGCIPRSGTALRCRTCFG